MRLLPSWVMHAKLQQVQMLPVFIGIGLGFYWWSVPLFVPGSGGVESWGLPVDPDYGS